MTDERTSMEEYLHKQFMHHRPEGILVCTRTDKPKRLALRPGQKRYIMAAAEISRMPEWVRVELYDTSKALIHGINIDDVVEDEEQWDVRQEHMHLLNLLSLNNHRQAKLYGEMFGDVLSHYRDLAANSVERAIGAERAWIKAIGEIADLSTSGNGETSMDQLMSKVVPKILDKFMAGGGDLTGLQKQIDDLQKRADAMKGKRS